MRVLTAVAVLSCALCVGCRSPRAAVQGAESLFHSISVSHHDWVLVRVIFPGDAPKTVCMTDNELERAIMIENGLEDEAYWQSLSNALHVGVSAGFRFEKPEVQEIIPPPCDNESLSEMREALSAYSDEELINHDFSAAPLELALPEGVEFDERVLPQALLERGLRPFLACFSGAFSIERQRGGTTR